MTYESAIVIILLIHVILMLIAWLDGRWPTSFSAIQAAV